MKGPWTPPQARSSEHAMTLIEAAPIDAAIALYPNSAALHAHRALILARRERKSFRRSSAATKGR